jgi:SNF2 family DNA or RNA helicase
VFIIDPWWNPAVEEQAINRTHRIGQDKNVMVYRFISTDTVEEKIQELKARKSKLADSFINIEQTTEKMNLSKILEFLG